MSIDGIEQKRVDIISDALSYLKSRGYKVSTVEKVFSSPTKKPYKRSSWDTERRIVACNKELKTIAEWARIWGIRYSACYRFILKYNLPFDKTFIHVPKEFI